jgi:hypothetical protein
MRCEDLLISAVLVLGLCVPIGANYAQDTTNQVTATCKDGSTFAGKTRSGACRGHGGVKSWGTAAESPATAPAAAAPAARTAAPSQQTPTTTPSSKVYHCPGTRWYGKTKQGEYMSEAQAKTQGDRPAHGKGCGS